MLFIRVFEKLWEGDVFEYCQGRIQENSFLTYLNNINVVLMPKKPTACLMKDLRSIALCIVLYKIVAKVLANRLKEILQALISEN